MTDRPCDRCGACDESSYGEEREHVMCAEVQIAFSLSSWLCYNCRKEYRRFAKNHHLSRKYGEAAFRLEFWQSSIKSNSSIEDGLKLWRIIEDLELDINDAANRWLITDMDEVRRN